jgi:FlaA1/EpsC-like NDP-sugar epimerase
MSALVAGLIAFRLRLDHPVELEPHVIEKLADASVLSLIYLFVFIVYFILFARFYGLYRMVDNKSGLHEQRMTFQATLTAALLLCGTLYVFRAYAVSRIVVVLTVLLTLLLVSLRRAVWRRLRRRRFLQGLETRNVLIVGDGRVGHALRNHLESLPHMGFRFKGFVALDERDEISPNPQVIGNVRNCVSLARSLFVDEI